MPFESNECSCKPVDVEPVEIADADYALVKTHAYSVRDRETSRQISLGYDVDTSDVLSQLSTQAAVLPWGLPHCPQQLPDLGQGMYCLLGPLPEQRT